MGRQINPMVVAKEDDAEDEEMEESGGFHNPLFSSSVGVKKDRRLFPSMSLPPAAKETATTSKSSSMVMRRHGSRDGRKEGTGVDPMRQRTDRLKKTTSERQIRRVSSQHVPACVVVKKGDASDAEEILQHCAFHMEAFRVHNKSAAAAGPPTTTFLFVFHGGQPNQIALEITHKPRPTSAGADGGGGGGGAARDDTILGRLPPSPTNGEGRVTMTLGGNSVPHLPGEPYSCHIHQVGTVTFNPRKQALSSYPHPQAKGSYLYILSQEGRTLFTALS